MTLADLAESPVSYVAYNAMRELCDSRSQSAKVRLLADPAVEALVEELRAWPGPRISSHRSASQFFHKLNFLADIGMGIEDPGIKTITDKILEMLDGNGVPFIAMDIPAAFGGKGENAKAWALCDAPNILYALKALGVVDARLDRTAHWLAEQGNAIAFGCVVSKSLGNWRGPGKKDDPCPYATLVMLKLLLRYGDTFTKEIAACAECLLDLWASSRTKHPYIFYMGNDFRRLKLPYIWYDILHVADVLSQVREARADPRFLAMIDIIRAKETQGGFVPESVYRPWKGWDFGQKTQASGWMTFCVRKIERRLSGGGSTAPEGAMGESV